VLKRKLITYRPAGAPVMTRWVSFGMPRLDNELIWCSFYLYRRNPKNGEIQGPCGSGVFVGRRPEDVIQKLHVYAVTSYHVAVTEKASIIRINTWDRDSRRLSHRFIERKPAEWSFIPNGDDIAALDVTDELDFDGPSHLKCVWEDDFCHKAVYS